jgi:hypothetical protein
MESDSVRARIEHGIAELRGAFPCITLCHAALQSWREGAQARHSLWLELRWPQHQSIISGPACDGADEALRAGFEKARHELEPAGA